MLTQMPLPVIVVKLIALIAPLAQLSPHLIRISKFVPKNQHGQVMRGIQLVYRRFGFEKTKEIIIGAGTAIGLITALKKLLKDDF